MRKLFTILLICLLTTSAFGQWSGVKPMLGRQINKAHQLGGPVAAWVFNEGSGKKVFDLSGYNNTGILEADTHFISGKFGPALDFDGTGDVVRISYSPEFNFTSAFSAIGYIYYNGSSFGNGALIAHLTDTGGNYNGWLIWLQDAILTFYINGGARSAYTFPSVAGWYHIACVWDGSYTRIYVNGIQEDSDAYSTAPVVDTTHDLLLGGYYLSGDQDANPPDNCAVCKLDHVLMYNRGLTAGEIALLYREPFCMFEEDNVALMALEAPTGVPVPVFYYHYINHALLFIPFGLYCYVRRRKCAA